MKIKIKHLLGSGTDITVKVVTPAWKSYIEY